MAQLKPLMKGPNEIVSFDHHAISYPQLASTKFDGFRCLVLCGERFVSPNLKDIRNFNLPIHLRELELFCRKYRMVVDGELWSPQRSFHMPVKEEGISSILTTHDRKIPADLKLHVFDMMSEHEWDNGTEKPFVNRYLEYKQLLAGMKNVVPVEQWHTVNAQEAENFFNGQLELGHEGMILRATNAKYKHGRTTVNQDGMWKFKEFQTHDAIIVGVEEQMKLKEGVERTRNVIGNLERRYEQDLYEPAGMVGAFLCMDSRDENSPTFKVKPGKGYDNTTKRVLFDKRDSLHNKHIEYKFMPHGTLDKPRIGSLVRFRPDLD